MTQQVTLSEIKAARERIKPYINETPLIHLHDRVYLKGEHHQVTLRFKPRGACNAMLLLPEEARRKGVIARSSGNFAQGLSFIGNKLGVDVTIVMPEHAPKVKVEATKSWGATVILKGSQHAEAQAVVDTLAKEKGLTKMHPFDHTDVISGQGTSMLEISEQIDAIDVFFCPVSGGGLMAGCATALKALNPNAIIIAVEPEVAKDYDHYRKTGEFITLTKAHSIADGLLAPRLGEHCKPLLDNYVDATIVVSEDSILHSMKKIKRLVNEDVEPSGAAAYAGYLDYSKTTNLSNKNIVCMASGGNFDKENFKDIHS